MIYLDNAATSFPRPKIVIDSVVDWLHTMAGSPGRGDSLPSQIANERVSKVRRQIARFFGTEEDYRVIFTYSATDALNMAIKGFIEMGDHVLISSMEHNSVLRPLKHLEREGYISLGIIPCNEQGYLDENSLWKMFKDQTRLVVLSHVSNVTGAVQPISSIGEKIRKKGAFLLLDAAQSTGNIPVKLDELKADMIVFAGHKGLYGLPGVGGLILGKRIRELKPYRQGGTGFNSQTYYQPMNWPEAFESGTMNMPGILSMGCGIEFIEGEGLDLIVKRKNQLLELLWDSLRIIKGMKLYGPEPYNNRIAVLSFTMEGWESKDIAEILKHNYSIQVRSGLHCAPLAHKTIGTFPEGTVRISPSSFTTIHELRETIAAIKNIALTQVVC